MTDDTEKPDPILVGPFHAGDLPDFLMDLLEKSAERLATSEDGQKPEVAELLARIKKRRDEDEIESISRRTYAFLRHVEDADPQTILNVGLQLIATIAARRMVPKPGVSLEMADQQIYDALTEALKEGREQAARSPGFIASTLRRKLSGEPYPEWMEEALKIVPEDIVEKGREILRKEKEGDDAH